MKSRNVVLNSILTVFQYFISIPLNYGDRFALLQNIHQYPHLHLAQMLSKGLDQTCRGELSRRMLNEGTVE